MNLIIVESPTKAKTISKFVGSDFEVKSSFGHVRDLPKSELGIDVKNDFEPEYIIPTKAKKNVSALRKDAQKADRIILATDEDREGEAIAWHLSQVLDLANSKSQAPSSRQIERIVFHEITKPAIAEAIRHGRREIAVLVGVDEARPAALPNHTCTAATKPRSTC